MVVKGSQLRNNEEVRELVRSSKEITPGQFLVVDRLNNMLVVDIEDGIIYNFDGEDLEEANTADQSKKANGYLYVQIAILDENNLPVIINYAQHSLIAMLAYTDDYDSLVEDDKTPIVNHKNNCPWDNYSKNLEWTTQKWNSLHGKVIHGIYHSDYSTTYTEIKHNQNKEVDFVCLKNRLSVKLIERYENYIKAQGMFKSLKEFWGLKDKTSIISNADIIGLIDWLDKQV